jgi:hypothetical protein
MARRRNATNAAQSSLTSPASSFALKTNREPEPFSNIIQMIKGHTDALKSATEKRAPPPALPYGAEKENSTRLYQMLTASSTSVPLHLKSEVALCQKLVEANKLSEQNNLHEKYALSHVGSSSGEFCKVIKVVTSPTPSTTASKIQPFKVVLPSTKTMSIPEFEERLENMRKPTVSLPADEAISERDTETPFSDQYDSAATDQYESASDRSSAPSKEISTSTSDGDPLASWCGVTMVTMVSNHGSC